MNINRQKTGEQVKAFCARIGKDPLLVQGAGGNVSWKEGDILWVKASGTWLADAITNDIFIPVDLGDLRMAIANKDFQAIPKVVGETKLRPSIETLLHTLMPHKVVAHLHAVEILAHLVRADPSTAFRKLIGGRIKWSHVEYYKPGPDLAKAVAASLIQKPDADVIFLQNHGVVLGGACVEDIEDNLQKLLTILKNPIVTFLNKSGLYESAPLIQSEFYNPCSDSDVNQLAISSYLSTRIVDEWILYPDHAVFLGGEPAILGHSFKLADLYVRNKNKPAFIFDIGKGVYESKSSTPTQKLQLRCYYDVIIRQQLTEKLVSLSRNSIAELLDWEAEKYREMKSK